MTELRFNAKKTKVVPFAANMAEVADLKLGGESIATDTAYKYLGATGAFESVEVVSSAPEEPYEVLAPVTSPRTKERSPSQGRAPVQQPMLVLPQVQQGHAQKHAVRTVISGRRRTADRHLEFFEKRLALEAEMREREAALDERRLSIEERRLAIRELELQQRMREFEAAQETRRQERAALLQQNQLLANALAALDRLEK
ncbi:hypothetical protein MRX96_023971 [Rhipicephalus microplus]